MQHILPSKRLCFVSLRNCLCNVVLAHPFQERHEGGEALSILRVAQLQDLNEIVDATGVLGVLGLFEEGIHILEDDGLLALFLLTSNLDNGLHGGVQVASADEISNVETIDLAISLE